jgi:hypothetical protein
MVTFLFMIQGKFNHPARQKQACASHINPPPDLSGGGLHQY